MPDYYYALIPHPEEPRFLLVRDGEGWTLPSTEVTNGFMAYVAPVVQWIRGRYGMAVTVLRCASLAKEGEGEPRVSHTVFACENHCEDTTLPEGGCWASRSELDNLRLNRPEHHAIIGAWLAEQEEPATISALRPPWARPGWFGETTRWIQETLSERGITATGPVEQLKTWSISCVLHLPTTEGTVYFKAVPALFATEPNLTLHLSRQFPGQSPKVIAMDTARNFLLLRELSGGSLRDVAAREPEARLHEEALRRFAHLQIACAGRTEELAQWGCRVRSLSRLSSEWEEILPELDDPEMRAIYGLTEEEADVAKGKTPQARALTEELAAFELPETLVHGDLHGGNVQVIGEGQERAYVFFDWSDGAVTHPFFDLITFLGSLNKEAEAAEHYGRCRDAYLEPWEAYLPREALLRSFDVAQQLAPVFHALSYRYIAQSMEPSSQWELSRAVGAYLKELP